MKTIVVSFVISGLVFGYTSGQTIKNIQASQDGDKIQITYDLESVEQKEFFVRAYASNDGGKNFNIGISDAAGEVNRFVKPGQQKKITWNAMNEVGEYQGMLRFKIIGLSNTARGKSENMDFIMGVMDVKPMDKDKFVLSLSFFSKANLTTSFSDKGFLIDNFGNSYKIISGVVGKQSFTNSQTFAANEQFYSEIVFQMSKANPRYTGGAPSEFQVRIAYGDNATLVVPKVTIGEL